MPGRLLPSGWKMQLAGSGLGLADTKMGSFQLWWGEEPGPQGSAGVSCSEPLKFQIQSCFSWGILDPPEPQKDALAKLS
jgi:hypothetical protein